MDEKSTARVKRNVRGNHILGDGRLSVIFGNGSVDLEKVYDLRVKHGIESPQAREPLRERLEDMGEIDERGQREHLNLSSQSRFVYAEGVGRTHNIQFVQLELIAREVKWGLDGTAESVSGV